MGMGMLVVGVIIVLAFLYLLLTNPTFVSLVTSALNFGTSVVQSGAVGQLVNATKGMNESAFLGWANSGNNTNPTISQIKESSNSTTLQPDLEAVWSGIKGVGSSQTVSSLTALINSMLAKAKQ
jgi:hypothetical protein